MKGFEQEAIEECYERLQRGKPLRIGEKLKAKTTSDFYPFLKQIASHRLFELDKRLQIRDGHWNLAVAMFKSVYGKNLFARHEYRSLLEFLRQHPNERLAQRSLETCKRILNLETKVLELAVKERPEFAKYYTGTQRTIKWLFVALATLDRHYAIRGREVTVARGMLSYYDLISKEASSEWKNYVNTGRTGRIDTDDVKRCLGDLTNQIILTSTLEPLEHRRFFSTEMREIIFKNSGGICQSCGTEISIDNFHADHIKPHSEGGATVVANGQALCTACNYSKGSTWKEVFKSADDEV
ncbi:MAG: HNH endonuclease [Nitrososphaera sp.]|nr:HNH endonuclease [Nitrososphaera sp.]